MLKTEVCPRVAAVSPKDERFIRQQDLAGSRATEATTKCFRNEGVRLELRLPSGADLSSLDVFANVELRRLLRRKDMCTRENAVGPAARALSEMAAVWYQEAGSMSSGAWRPYRRQVPCGELVAP